MWSVGDLPVTTWTPREAPVEGRFDMSSGEAHPTFTIQKTITRILRII
jgi:hypothetical protein